MMETLSIFAIILLLLLVAAILASLSPCIRKDNTLYESWERERNKHG